MADTITSVKDGDTLIVPIPDMDRPRRVNRRDPDSVAKYERYMELHGDEEVTPGAIEKILLGTEDKIGSAYERAMQALEGTDFYKGIAKQDSLMGESAAQKQIETGKEPRRIRRGHMRDAYNSALKREVDEYAKGQ